MSMLSKERFLQFFHREPTPSFHQFVKKSVIVSYLGKEKPLTELVQSGRLKEADLRLMYEQIQNRDAYLSAFYDRSLQVHEKTVVGTVAALSLENPMPKSAIDNDKETRYKNVIRNLFYREILEETKSGISNVPSFWTVMTDFYLRGRIDYKLITPSALHYMRENKISSNFSSFYFRASIMNPYLVYSLQEQYFQGERIFTPTLGWGSYLTGFLASPRVREYVGVDVIPSVCRKIEAVGKSVENVKVDIYCKGSEILAKNAAFRRKYAGHFDTVFFSPPYYELEMYAGDAQSVRKYKTYPEWLEGYWRPTMELCRHVLVKGGGAEGSTNRTNHNSLVKGGLVKGGGAEGSTNRTNHTGLGQLCFIISDYEGHSLVKDMKAIAVEEGFRFIKKIPMLNKQVNYREKDRGEQILFFR